MKSFSVSIECDTTEELQRALLLAYQYTRDNAFEVDTFEVDDSREIDTGDDTRAQINRHG